MRRIFLFLLVSFSSTFCYSQQEEIQNHAVAIHINSNSSNYDGMSFRYMRKIKNAGRVKLMFHTDFDDLLRWKVGYEIIWLQIGSFEYGSGIDTKFSFISANSTSDSNYRELTFEIPLESRVTVFNNWRILTGVSWIKRIWTNVARVNEDYSYEIRVGLEYKF